VCIIFKKNVDFKNHERLSGNPVSCWNVRQVPCLCFFYDTEMVMDSSEKMKDEIIILVFLEG
jgi:tryptophanase